MKSIQSTNASVQVDEHIARAMMDLINDVGSPRFERHTYQEPDSSGQSRVSICLVPFVWEALDLPMWAVDQSDENSREVEVTWSRDEAAARYEEMVRDASGLLGEDQDGAPNMFEYTDVVGVPAVRVASI